MRTLDDREVRHVAAAANPANVFTVVAGTVTGSIFLGTIMSALSPLSTVAVTIGGTVCGAILGTEVLPVIGTFIGAVGFGAGGYYFGSSLITASSYLLGAFLGGTGTYAFLQG